MRDFAGAEQGGGRMLVGTAGGQVTDDVDRQHDEDSRGHQPGDPHEVRDSARRRVG